MRTRYVRETLQKQPTKTSRLISDMLQNSLNYLYAEAFHVANLENSIPTAPHAYAQGESQGESNHNLQGNQDVLGNIAFHKNGCVNNNTKGVKATVSVFSPANNNHGSHAQ